MENKNSNVRISPDEQGNVIRVSKNNPEYGHVRLTQTRVGFSATGWVKRSNLSTLIHGLVEDLQEIGLTADQPLPGNIIIKEQTEAFDANDPDRDLKIAGETGIVCCRHGEPIYRKAFYDASGTLEDEFIAHTNGDAIREANASEETEKKGNLTQAEMQEMIDNTTEDPEVKAKPKSKKKDKEEEENAPQEEIVMEAETFEL